MCTPKLQQQQQQRNYAMSSTSQLSLRWLRVESGAAYTTVLLLLSTMVPGTAVGSRRPQSQPHRPQRHQLFMGHVPAPEFLPGTSNVTVRPGDAALLPCSVRYLGTKQVVWRNVKEDRFLTIGDTTWSDDSNISLDYSRKPDHVTNWDLVISHARPEDAGIYECQITTRAMHIRRVMLNVVGTPITKSVISITGQRYVNLGDRLELVCNATGGPRIPDEIDWFKTGNKIDSDKPQYRHAVITKFQSIADRSFISKLIIKHATLSDTGDYICRSSRNDIANLKVTVLHTESDNKRRESSKQYEFSSSSSTDPEGNKPPTGNWTSRPLPTLTLLLVTLLCVRQLVTS